MGDLLQWPVSAESKKPVMLAEELPRIVEQLSEHGSEYLTEQPAQ